MSDHIPFEIQSEIIKTLPVKSLIQFRSVCKSWKSLIDSSDFIAHYRTQQQHMLVRYEIGVNFEGRYVSIVDDNDDDDDNDNDDDDDDDSFPNQIVSVTAPPLVQELRNYIPIGSSHGLLCLFGEILEWTKTGRVVIWNPCIRKAVAVVVPNMACDKLYRTVVGFGVCRETIDPKLVKITFGTDLESVTSIPWQVEVFTLTTRAWRSPHGTNLPRGTILIDWDPDHPVVVDGCVYWLACDRLFGLYKLIISFDMTTEEFREDNLPDRLARNCSLSMYKLRESIVLLEHGLDDNYKKVFHVWMMEDGVPKSFIKLYTISNHSPNVSTVGVRGFRKTGEPLMEVVVQAHHGSTRILAVYDPYSKFISNVVIKGGKFYVHSYMETLLLL